MLNAKISWLITGQKTIGSYIFYLEFLNFIAIILFIYFVYQLSSQLNLKNQTNNFFIFVSIISYIYLWNENIWRDIPLILFLIISLNYLTNKSINSILFLSFLSVFTFFWSLDRGFFVFLVYIFFITIILINNKKEFLKFILSTIIFWIIAILFLGLMSLKNFFYTQKKYFRSTRCLMV